MKPLKCETFPGVREQEQILQGKRETCGHVTLKVSAAGK